jgi:hypothetical protein
MIFNVLHWMLVGAALFVFGPSLVLVEENFRILYFEFNMIEIAGLQRNGNLAMLLSRTR